MSKCWYCNEEITSGNNPEHLGICNKCYDEMFKCGNDFVKNMITKMSDLEAKLAESEKDRLLWQEMYKSADKQNKEICETDIYPLQEQVQQLKQQLAEKDTRISELEDKDWFEATIKQLEDQNDRLIKERDDANLKLAYSESKQIILEKRIEKQVDNSYKIIQNCKELQIEQLEKVKEMVKPYLRFDWNLYLQVCENIDNQIKQLKGEK